MIGNKVYPYASSVLSVLKQELKMMEAGEKIEDEMEKELIKSGIDPEEAKGYAPTLCNIYDNMAMGSQFKSPVPDNQFVELAKKYGEIRALVEGDILTAMDA